MDLCELTPAHIRAIAPYPPGKPISELAREMNLNESDIIKLASNENPLGASPRALAAMENVFMEIARYPDGNGYALKSALSAHLGVALDQIVLGNGSNDVLELVARAFLTAQTSAVYAQHAFAVYPLVTLATGARGIEAPARDFGHDPKALLEAIDNDTRVLFIANPNNPTGTLIKPDELLALIERVPKSVIVVLDEAYTEYLPEALRSDSMNWQKRFPNLIVTRTFSKAYGLAGLRIGYAVTSAQVADMLNRVRQPFNVNSLAQAAAIAALQDEAFLAECQKINRKGMEQITTGLERLNLSYIPSYGNFVTFRIPPFTPSGDKGNATAMYQSLLRKGVIVRPVGNYGMSGHLRVSIGLEEENRIFLSALENAIQEQ
jgi:histidinol-phosphate aminotransferase